VLYTRDTITANPSRDGSPGLFQYVWPLANSFWNTIALIETGLIDPF